MEITEYGFTVPEEEQALAAVSAAKEPLPVKPPKRVLAMAYVPEQEFSDLYEKDEALAHGTLFRELDLPFIGKREPR